MNQNTTTPGGSVAPKKQRQSNIELLRIITMVMIVAHHFSVHGDFNFPINTISVNRLWIQFIQIGGKIGVDVFVLISGYFLITSTSIKWNRVIKIWLQIFTYSVLIYVVLVSLGIQPFGIKDLIKCLFPVTFSQWWFASAYFVLYLFSPYINRALKAFDQRTYLSLLGLMTFCWCIIPTAFSETWQCNDLLWFIYLYLLAGYIRLYGIRTALKGSTYILISCGLILLTFLSAVFFDFVGLKLPFVGMMATFFYEMHQLPILLISVTMFLGFLKIDIGCRPAANAISATTFGVYLIHDNAYMRDLLWKTIFKNATFADTIKLIPYSLVVVFLVFIVCSLIELIRINVFEVQYMKLVDRLTAPKENTTKKTVLLDRLLKTEKGE